jgi:hypothetical protein
MLLQENKDVKYIIVVENVGMIARVTLPEATCIFATVEYQRDDEPTVRFYKEETPKDGD